MAHTRTILVADDDQTMRLVLERALARAGFRAFCFASSHQLLLHLDQQPADLVITDIVMPSGSGLDLLQTIKARHPLLPVIVMTAQSTLRHAVQSFERGAFEYLPKPFDINDLVDLVHRALESVSTVSHRPSATAAMERFGGIIGCSRAMQELFRTIGRLSNSEVTVLIHGESGTGKELVAHAIHANSPRKQGPFIALNMAALPRNLIESELFGHEKGAFTGAIARRPGHFEQARNGTLFLDEIGDMPIEAQTRLLRVLQDGTYTRVGGTQTLHSDVRIITATHQDLRKAIVEGRFREDLFYRLNVIPVTVPSLRYRREDIPLLADYFLDKSAQALSLPTKRLTQAGLDRLMRYDWPGNVRELENLIHRLTVLVPDELIEEEAIPLAESGCSASHTEPVVAQPVPTTPNGAEQANYASPPTAPQRAIEQAIQQLVDLYLDAGQGLYDQILQQVDRAILTRVLRETGGNQFRAANLLGINRNTLRKKIHMLNLQIKK
ncbi:MAG: nitrogen regulation protein NR(I) [Magnetococcales bacterium]|nr:nitrogen regulation protein NR(I) [Magnetococcales bacterium]